MIEEFKSDLLILSDEQIVRKHILNGSCHALNDDMHFKLKERICDHFNIEFNEVILVGSGKLGFSIKPNKRYHPFGDESDIDVAVVSTDLFTKIWQDAYSFKKSGVYWPKCDDFFQYLSEGWIRPDKLPTSEYFKFTEYWWGFFNGMTASKDFGPYKIRAGLYHSIYFMQEYQKICISQCIEEIKSWTHLHQIAD